MAVLRWLELVFGTAAAALGVTGIVLRATVGHMPSCTEYDILDDGALISSHYTGYACEGWLPTTQADGALDRGLLVFVIVALVLPLAIGYGAVVHSRGTQDWGRIVLWTATRCSPSSGSACCGTSASRRLEHFSSL